MTHPRLWTYCSRIQWQERYKPGTQLEGRTPFTQYGAVMPCTRLLKSGRILFPATLFCLSNEILREIWRAAARVCRNSIVRNRITRAVRLIFQSSTLFLIGGLSSSPLRMTLLFFLLFSSPLRRRSVSSSSATWNVPRSVRTYTHFRNYEWTRLAGADLCLYGRISVVAEFSVSLYARESISIVLCFCIRMQFYISMFLRFLHTSLTRPFTHFNMQILGHFDISLISYEKKRCMCVDPWRWYAMSLDNNPSKALYNNGDPYIIRLGHLYSPRFISYSSSGETFTQL